MKIYTSTITIDGVRLNGENPLPRFCDPVQDRNIIHDGTFAKEDEKLLGSQTGTRVLPYLMQDRYTRERSPQTIKTIVLENDLLTATFLPDYGARLYSLLNKKTGKDILFTNQTLQFGNLAQRNAWFSGGIEFNFGHYGHSAQSNSPFFAAEVRTDNQTFLRFYEYERVTGAFYQMDFYLPDGSSTLDMHVRLLNLTNEDLPTYWWTNIALPETENCRVLSGTPKVLAALPRRVDAPEGTPHFGAYDMPFLPVYNGDASYPAKIDFSCEYFFQYKNESAPWEAVAYEDGRMFYEVSTQVLNTRKMFCWGNHQGGSQWHRWLNSPSDARYVEIQGGIAPTQLHGATLPANSAIQFTQCFGETTISTDNLTNNWQDACSTAEEIIRINLSNNLLEQKHEAYSQAVDAPIQTLLHMGSGWGALENANATGLSFPASSIDEAQLPWLTLLQEGIFPGNAVWQTGKKWRKLLEESLTHEGGRHPEALLHYGVMLLEAGDNIGAKKAWDASLELKKQPITLRNLAQLYKREGNLAEAIALMAQALKLPSAEDPAYTEEYLQLLIAAEQYELAWQVFQGVTSPTCYMEITISIAAETLGKNDYLETFFAGEYAGIKESKTVLTDVWYRYQAKKHGISEQEARATLTPPANLDFRMHNSY